MINKEDKSFVLAKNTKSFCFCQRFCYDGNMFSDATSNKNFVHLHTHSHYSLLDGLAKIDQLIEKAKSLGMPALALTDHGVMYGVIEFYQKCLKAGIKPIIGVEVYIAPRKMTDKQPKIDTRPYHFVLLAKNYTGYRNLVKLVTEAHLQGYYYKPRIDKDLLKKYSQGLIGLTACLHGEIPRLILSGQIEKAKSAIIFYQDVLGKDDLYLELQDHPELPEQKIVNKKLIELSKEISVPLVVTNDIHYLNHDDLEAHEVLLSVQTGKDFDDKARLSMKDIDLSLKSAEEIGKGFKNVPQALGNTLKVAERCDLRFELGKPILPKFEVPEGSTPMSYLTKLAREGFSKRYHNNPAAEKRLQYELSVIEKTGFADYFLIVADFINWAKKEGIIVGPGRGSAAGSIVSYSLNITDLDPLPYGLLFERFLNPERISMPDIDIDFADDRRDEVIAYVKEKYGENHVAQIITFGTMAARGSIRDTARALGLSYNDGDRLAKLIPFGLTIRQAMENVGELRQIYEREPEMKKLIEMAKKLEGVARHASTHACGIVISKKPLTEYLPLQQAQKGETATTTQYPMFDVEAIGLLKMDFLGLSNLTIIKNTLRIVRKIKNQDINIHDVALDDRKTYQLLAKADTTGVFQLESEGMKRYLKELKPSEFNDLIAMVALYRPGPIELIPQYVKRKFGKEKITYLHPKLESVLKDTYGIMIYQEQLMNGARALSGITLSEADILRKAVGKKIPKLLREQKNKIIDGAKKNGVKKEIAEQFWALVEPFDRYGFNKSHAASYALIAYQTAYLKAHFPTEFMAALLTSDFGNLDRVAIEINECERLKIEVLPPDVNKSFVEFGVVVENENILFGLAAIKNVGVGVAEKIVEERKKGKYSTLTDFVMRLGSTIINKKTMEALIKSGALDLLGERNQMLAGLEQILKFSSQHSKQTAGGQVSLFENSQAKIQVSRLELPKVDVAPKQQKLSWEKELLGIYLSEHPLDDVKDQLAKVATTIKSLDSIRERQKTAIGGVINSIHKIITKNKEPMLFVELEDTTGNLEVIVFPKVLKTNPLIWQTENIILVKGHKNSKDGVTKFIADEAKVLDLTNLQNEKKDALIIKVPPRTTKEELLKLKQILFSYPGSSKVMMSIPSDGDYKKIALKDKVAVSDELIGALEHIVDKENIIF